MTATTDTFSEWVIIELMGHRRLAGHLTEIEIAGEGFLRLDVPGPSAEQTATQFYRPAAVYCITPTTEELARAVALRSHPEPVSRYELGPVEPTGTGHDDDDSGWLAS